MRRMLVGMLLCVGVVLGVAAFAGAQTGSDVEQCGEDPYPACLSTQDPTAVAGTTATRSASGSDQLPFTGSDGTSTLVWVGGGLALAGGAVVAMSYRRRASLQG